MTLSPPTSVPEICCRVGENVAFGLRSRGVPRREATASLKRLKAMPNLQELIWAQEEPKNNGAWFFVESLIEEQKDELAGVIVEPFQRLLPPQPGFLHQTSELDTLGARIEEPAAFVGRLNDLLVSLSAESPGAESPGDESPDAGDRGATPTAERCVSSYPVRRRYRPGVIDCAPSVIACAGSLCTSMISPSAPAATAARHMLSTRCALPVP